MMECLVLFEEYGTVINVAVHSNPGDQILSRMDVNDRYKIPEHTSFVEAHNERRWRSH